MGSWSAFMPKLLQQPKTLFTNKWLKGPSILSWRKLSDESGGFYSSLDADSLTEDGELEEGAYYIWREKELKSLLKEDFDIFKDYFNINSLWSLGAWQLCVDQGCIRRKICEETYDR